MTTRKLAALVLLASVSPVALASHALAEEVTFLDTITVMGTRTAVPVRENPRSVSVIERSEIERQAPQTIAQILRDVPGVQVADESVAGMQRIRIRGESSRRVTILVDGQEITDHSTYGTPLLVDPSVIERIEVVRGPSSVLFGAKAIGGVINIVTRGGADKPIQFETGGSLYSASRGWQGFAAVSGTLGQFDYRFSVGGDRHGDRDVPKSRWAPSGKLDDTSFHNDNLYAHLGYRFGAENNHYLALKAERHRLTSQGWPGTPVAGQDFRIDLPKRDRTKVGLYYDVDRVTPIIAKIHADAFYQTVERVFENRVTVRTTPTRSVAVNSTSEDRIANYGGNFQIDLNAFDKHYTILGLQYLGDTLDTKKGSTTVMTGFGPRPVTTISTSRDKASIDTLSVYAQDEWTLPHDFKLTAGARLYNTRTSLNETTTAARANLPAKDDTAVVKSVGLTWSGLPNTVLRTSYSEGYITPTLLQLFGSTTAGGQGVTYGNPSLKPETSRNVEFGVRYDHQGLVLDAAAFLTRAQDYIGTTRCLAVGAACLTAATAASSASYYVNADKATTYGLELLAEYRIGESGFTPYASGTLMRRKLDFGTYTTYNSDTPVASGRFGLRYEGRWDTLPYWADLFVRAGSGSKQTYEGTGGLVTDKSPSWATLNLAAGASFGPEGRYSLAVAVNNIFDRAYRPTLGELPAVGRSVEVTARMKF
ncbi:TonB-dependent receptor [Bosea sp. (in: a-proteobacteria)]|uniref:TonB-dependent receptor plug domain-containing protein n=1 Tax=Bosea sp. (in: a-proteobacteria) TaxID=1871050 RepID=UPI0026044653|nr:TonB-dependent receptor [Bosea sp. (in: a-proteobacteria)]MCO5091357.1 TonB-dependent receptor [Bosea sp. (in: a-proteobacteria)]